MNKTNFVSIKIKLIALLSASAFLALILSSIVIFTYTFYNTKEGVVQGLTQLTTVIGQNLVAPLEFDDKDAADLMLHSFQDEENIKGAYIFKNTELFTSYVNKKASKNLVSETILYVYGKHDRKTFIKYVDFNDILISHPIYSENEFLGTFTIVSSTSDIKNTLISQLWMELSLALVVLLIIILLSIKLQEKVTRPIFKLYNEMKYFSEHNKFENKLQAAHINDEFQNIFNGCNLMMDKINLQEASLNTMKDKTLKTINFATLIQKTILPKEQDISKYFQEYFTHMASKDAASNKIYLFDPLRLDKDECLFVMIDCSEDGTEGSFKTILMRALERSIVSKLKNSHDDISPAKILSDFSQGIKNLSNNKNSDLNLSFFGSVFYFNKKENYCKFSGAKASLVYTDEYNDLHLFQGESTSISGVNKDVQPTFNEYELSTKSGMQIYLSTDENASSLQKEDNLFYKTIDSIKDKSFLKQKSIYIDAYQQQHETHGDDYMIISLKL